MTDLPLRLKQLRKEHNYSLDVLASKTGITKSYLSKLERGLNEPSISTVIKLAEAYSIGIPTLLGLEENKSNVHLVRHKDLLAMDKSTNKFGYFYKAVAGNRQQDIMTSFIIYPATEGHAKDVSVPHKGEEFMYVIDGTAKLIIAKEEYILNKGDSIYFNSELAHHIFSIKGSPAEVLVVAANREL